MEIAQTMVGIVQLIIGVVFAVISLYIGFSIFGRITKGIDEVAELKKGNTAIGILIAAVFLGIAIVVQSGVAGISTGISTALKVGIFSIAGILSIVAAFVQLIVGIALAIATIYLALIVLDHLTEGIDEFKEIAKGNNAVALEMAGVIIAVAVIIQSGVMGITSALL